MTVSVTLAGGGVDDYLRFGDSYVEHGDGSLDVVRTGAKKPFSYAAGQWTDVRGDPCRSIKHRFLG